MCTGSGALIGPRRVTAAALATLAVVGAAVGLAVVPQQNRLFATVPRIASVAVGLNGSAIYLASAAGAGLGGLALSAGSSAAVPVAAACVGAVAVLIAVTVIPEQMRAPE